MGELGFPTRVLSPVFGGVYTYAAPMLAQGTAAGQVSARSLRHLYRVEKLAKAAKIYGVIADPVRHSISPAVHNRAFQSRRIDAVYLPFWCRPRSCAISFRSPNICRSPDSASPFRTSRRSSAIWMVDPLAERIGAVNTVWRKAGKWRGTNTDAARRHRPAVEAAAPAKATVLIVGQRRRRSRSGFALSEPEPRSPWWDAIPIASALSPKSAAPNRSCANKSGPPFRAVIHATPLGMCPT